MCEHWMPSRGLTDEWSEKIKRICAVGTLWWCVENQAETFGISIREEYPSLSKNKVLFTLTEFSTLYICCPVDWGRKILLHFFINQENEEKNMKRDRHMDVQQKN